MLKCILTKAKVIDNMTINQDEMLNAIFPNEPPNSQYLKNVKMFLLECFNHTEIRETIDCWKTECERYGFNPYSDFDVDITFPRPFIIYFGLSQYKSKIYDCFSVSNLELDLKYIADIAVRIKSNSRLKINGVFHTILSILISYVFSNLGYH